MDLHLYLKNKIQEDLKWKEQLTNTCNKACFTLLNRNLQHCLKECQKTAYIALVRSIKECGSIIWNPYTMYPKRHRQIAIHTKKGARFLNKNFKSRNEGCMTNMLSELQLPSLQSRRHQQD